MNTKLPMSMRLYRTLLHRLPLVSGLTKLSFNRLTNWSFGANPGSTVASLKDGTPIEVSLNDYHGRILYFFGNNDPKVTHLCCALLRRGDVFLDIGANYGSIGLAAAHAVGGSGEVHLFEPQRLLCDRVEQAICAGSYTNVHLHRVGLLDRSGSFELARPPHHSGMATFAPRSLSDGWQKERCDVRDIAEYLPSLLRDRPFGVKLDVEGVEPRILPWLMSQSGLRYLVYEADHHQSVVWDAVARTGFAVYGCRRHPFILELELVRSLVEMLRFHDLVTIRWPTSLAQPRRINPYALAKRLVEHDARALH